ncbi:hypothetical protein [Seohaeicola nanhaiensis]|uniref:hypothetical protein n=1 Tax=Seohaeicola nanhaiensis TaxID=1387282 RepID=UPI0036D240BA
MNQTSQREPYCPTNEEEWRDTWEMLCGHCAHHLNCPIVDAMIEHTAGGSWPEGGWTSDPGGGVTCLSYAPHQQQPQLTRQQLRRLSRMNPATLPPVCGGCAATKGTEASQCLHTRRDFEVSVRDRRQFLCHERPGYCGGWVRAVLARAGKRVQE